MQLRKLAARICGQGVPYVALALILSASKF